MWKIKTGAKMAPFWCGMIVFFVFAMLLEQVSHYINQGSDIQNF
ncbi:MAG: hypothetical protein GX685_01120 [Clostridiales bacterium]|nr:hypothetical protein [Clostridiales bacterium]